MSMRRVRRVAAALACASFALVAGCAAAPTLRSDDVQDQIAEGLAAQVGGDFTVTCPTGVLAQVGTTFTCSVTDVSDGRSIMVIVTEVDDAGGFEWRVQMASASATPAASSS